MSFGYMLAVIVSMDGTPPMAMARRESIIADITKNNICKAREAASVGGLFHYLSAEQIPDDRERRDQHHAQDDAAADAPK
jgi:hypothetical protein